MVQETGNFWEEKWKTYGEIQYILSSSGLSGCQKKKKLPHTISSGTIERFVWATWSGQSCRGLSAACGLTILFPHYRGCILQLTFRPCFYSLALDLLSLMIVSEAWIDSPHLMLSISFPRLSMAQENPAYFRLWRHWIVYYLSFPRADKETFPIFFSYFSP